MRPLLATLVVAGCVNRPVYVRSKWSDAERPPLVSSSASVDLPEQVDRAATVVVDVEGEPARVALLGASGAAGRITCAATPCAFAVPEGAQALAITRFDARPDDAVTYPGDTVEIDVVRGERLLITHRMSEIETKVIKQPREELRLIRAGYAFPAIVLGSALVASLPGLGLDTVDQWAITGISVTLGSVLAVAMTPLGRPTRVRATVTPSETRIDRYFPP